MKFHSKISFISILLFQVTVWDAVSSSDVKAVNSIGSSNVPVVSVAIKKDLLILGRLDGCVQIHSLGTCNLQAQITAHSRFLSAMDVHPTKDVIATASEDATLNVWSLPMKEPKVQCLFSANWMQGLLTGVAFCGDNVAAVAFDAEEIRLYKCSL
jgi:WD40 repeat protein